MTPDYRVCKNCRDYYNHHAADGEDQWTAKWNRPGIEVWLCPFNPGEVIYEDGQLPDDCPRKFEHAVAAAGGVK